MPDGGRRGLVAGGIIALVLVAFSVFVLPFAFTTPPPIITRFVATRAFSPGNDQGRAVATVAIRLSEPSNVVSVPLAPLEQLRSTLDQVVNEVHDLKKEVRLLKDQLQEVQESLRDNKRQ